MSSREKVRSKLSCAYTQTIVRLYPNNHSLILKLKRFSKRGTMYTRLIISFVTNRAIAFELWMKSPMPMVTFTKTFDVSRLCKVSRRRGMRSASGRLLPDGRLARCPVPGRTTKNNQYIKINEDVSKKDTSSNFSKKRCINYQICARCSAGTNILSPFLMPKASYQLSIIGRAAITRRRLGE